MVTESKFSDKDDKSENIISVYNLPSMYDESDVHSLFANVGTVVQCSIERDTSNSSSRAIVKFSSEKEADDAVVLSGVSVRYHILKIIKGKPPVIAQNGDHKDSISKETRNKIAQSVESIRETGKRIPLKVPEEEASSYDRSSPPESDKRNETNRTATTKRDYNRASDHRSRDRSTRIRSASSSNSDTSRDSSRSGSRDRYRNRRDYTPSRSHSRYRSRRGSRYGRSRKEYRRGYSRSRSRSSSYSSRSDDYSRGSSRSNSRSSYYSDESDRHYSRVRKGDRRRGIRSRSRKRYGSGHRYRR